jgi:hypothetical protein
MAVALDLDRSTIQSRATGQLDANSALQGRQSGPIRGRGHLGGRIDRGREFVENLEPDRDRIEFYSE